MTAKQTYYLLWSVLVLLFAALFGIAYGADKLMGSQAVELSKLRADSALLDTQQVSLTKNKRDVTKYSELNKIAQTVVPQDKDQAAAVREIVNLAAQSGIGKLTSITFPSSTLGTSALGPRSTSNLTQLTPLKDIQGVYLLQITISQSDNDRVLYGQFINFLTKLEQNRRTAQVSGITVQPSVDNPNLVAFTLVINEYIKP